MNYDAYIPAIRDRAIELLETENGWIQGKFAVRADGRWISYEHPSACGFCLMGAMAVAVFQLPLGGQAQNDAYDEAADAWCEANRGKNIAEFNDTEGRTKDEVVQSLRNMKQLIGEETHEQDA